MKTGYMLDANVLVYAYDRSEMEKKLRARSILDFLQSNGLGYLSTQVLGEFFWVVTRKLHPPLLPSVAYGELEKHSRAWPVLPVDSLIVLEAARGSATHRVPYWDAQIWATARMNQIPVVLSEDFSHGRALRVCCFIIHLSSEFRERSEPC